MSSPYQLNAIKLKSKLFNENPIALDTMYNTSLAYIALIRNKNNPNQTINIKFNELFSIESLTVLGKIPDDFKSKLMPMNPDFKLYSGGIN